MKYTLRHIEDDQWDVHSADDVSVFVGTLRDCEDWLDRQENRERKRGSLFKSMSRWVRRLVTGDREETPPPDPAGEDTPPSATA